MLSHLLLMKYAQSCLETFRRFKARLITRNETMTTNFIVVYYIKFREFQKSYTNIPLEGVILLVI